MNKPLISDDAAQKMMWQTIDGFDFEKAHAYCVLTNWGVNLNGVGPLVIPTAINLRDMAFNHLNESYQAAKRAHIEHGIFQGSLFSAGILARWTYGRDMVGCSLEFVLINTSAYMSVELAQ